VRTRWHRDFGFDVGDLERHRVEVYWGQIWGDTEIRVDGHQALRSRRMFEIRRTRRFQIDVGRSEVHSVTVEKYRPAVLSGVRQQTFRALVDGQLVGEF
jgi:hypothetical protein